MCLLICFDRQPHHSQLRVSSKLTKVFPYLSSSGLYTVAYLPLEPGIYEITIRWNGKDVPHSPFKAKITETKQISCIGGWSRFLDDSGLLRFIVGEEMSIPLEVGESPGKIVAELKTPNGMVIPVNVEKISASQVRLYFTPIESGEWLFDQDSILRGTSAALGFPKNLY